MTTKESWLFGTMSKKLLKENHEVLITTRDYDQNKEILDLLKCDHNVIGKHGGEKLKDKLVESLKRSLELTNFIANQDPLPDFCVCLASPEALRVAFGLGIKGICVNDTPHAVKVGKLTAPLSDYLITPSCIDENQFIEFGINKSKIIKYNGVDEFTWLKDFKPNIKVLEKLGIDLNKKFIILRIIESKSAYYLNLSKEKSFINISDELINNIIQEFPDLQVILLSRYDDQKKYFKDKYKDKIILPIKGINGPNISYFADIVISGGGTMNREAAILGTPAICYFPLDLEVNEFIIKEGFPLWHIKDVKGIIEMIKKILSSKKLDKNDIAEKVKKYEDVYDAFIKILNNIRS